MADENTSLKDDLMAAAEEHGGIEEEDIPSEESPETTASSDAEEALPGEAGEEAPAETAENQEAAPEGEPEPEPSVDEPPAPAPTGAPVGWNNELAAKFSELDPDVQAKIVERDQEVNQVLQDTKAHREISSAFMQAVEPYQMLMQAEGVQNPIQAVAGLMDVTAKMRFGTQVEKAQTFANLIQHYGVDIGELDRVLAGEQVSPEAQTQNTVQQQINLAMSAWQQQWQQQQDFQRQQGLEVQANQSISEFAADPQNKHYEAVRHIMADFLDMAAANGQQMTLPEAYQRACASSPEVMAQIQAEMTGNVQQGMMGKENAASSIGGKRRGGPMPGAENMSLRDTIAAQFADPDRI